MDKHVQCLYSFQCHRLDSNCCVLVLTVILMFAKALFAKALNKYIYFDALISMPKQMKSI